MTAIRRLAAILAGLVAKVCLKQGITGRANRELT